MTAQQAYESKLEESQALLAKIEHALKTHKTISNGTWANVGDLSNVVAKLQEISDFACHEAEYA